MKFNEHGYTMKAWEAPDSEVIRVCAECLSTEADEVSRGDEIWTVCPDCRSVEAGYKYIHESEAED